MAAPRLLASIRPQERRFLLGAQRTSPQAVRFQRSLYVAILGELRRIGVRVAADVVREYGRLAKASVESRALTVLKAVKAGRFYGLRTQIEPILQRVSAYGVKLATSAIRSDVTAGSVPIDVGITNKPVIDYAKERAARLVGMRVLPSGAVVPNPNPAYSIGATTRKMLGATITKALKEGWSQMELRRAIQAQFAFSAARANAIARTEMVGALIQGNIAAYEAHATPTKKQWLLSNTHPKPDICDDNAAQGVIPWDEDFNSGDPNPPAHPFCECDLLIEPGEPAQQPIEPEPVTEWADYVSSASEAAQFVPQTRIMAAQQQFVALGGARMAVVDSQIGAEVAEKLVPILEGLKGEGYELPPYVRIDYAPSEKAKTLAGQLRTTAPQRLSILIPKNLPAGADFDAVIRLAHENDPKWANVTTLRELVIHELGHFINGPKHLYDMKSLKSAVWGEELVALTGEKNIAAAIQTMRDYLPEDNNSVQDTLALREITDQVGEYAGWKPSEFMAETFLRLYKGDRLSPEVMGLYEELGGKLPLRVAAAAAAPPAATAPVAPIESPPSSPPLSVVMQQFEEAYKTAGSWGLSNIVVQQDDPEVIRMAAEVAAAMRQLAAEGLPMPGRLQIIRQLGEDARHIKVPAASVEFIDRRRDDPQSAVMVIRLPRDLPPGANLDDVVRVSYAEMGGDKYTPIKTFRELMIHEMAHVARTGPSNWGEPILTDALRDYFKANPEAFPPDVVVRADVNWADQWESRMNVLQFIAGKVGKYASTNPSEFLAEAYVRLHRGETLPEPARLLYEALHGIVPQASQVAPKLSTAEAEATVSPRGTTPVVATTRPLPGGFETWKDPLTQEQLDQLRLVYREFTGGEVSAYLSDQMHGGKWKGDQFIEFTARTKAANLLRIEDKLEEVASRNREAFEQARRLSVVDAVGGRGTKLTYDQLPEFITVYRGHTPGEKIGKRMNVTLDRATAEKWGSVVSTFTVSKHDISFVFGGASSFGEQELLILGDARKALTLVTEQPITYPPTTGSVPGAPTKSAVEEAQRTEEYAPPVVRTEGPLKSFSFDATLRQDGVIATPNVEDAALALWMGRRVDLDQPKKVAILLDRLAGMVKDAIAQGAKAPPINLCNVTVAGTSLFCQETHGIPRIIMPQLKNVPLKGSKAATLPADERGEVDATDLFRAYLQQRGVTFEDVDEFAAFMKATQNELDGVKVAAIARAAMAGKLAPARLFLSRDNYILDGHHRWAAIVGVDSADDIWSTKMPVTRVDMGIIELIYHARKFCQDIGLPSVSMTGGVKLDVDTGMRAAAYMSGLKSSAAIMRGSPSLFDKDYPPSTALSHAYDPSLVPNLQAAAAIKAAAKGSAIAVSVENQPLAIKSANAVASVLEELSAEGYPIPGALNVKMDRVAGPGGLTSQTVEGTSDPGSLSVDIILPAEAPASAGLNRLTDVGMSQGLPPAVANKASAVRSFRDLVVHEMAHVYNWVPFDSWEQAMATGTFRDALRGQGALRGESWLGDTPLYAARDIARVARGVGLYGMQNPAEFMAEAFVRLYRGEKLPAKVKAVYDALGGKPVLPHRRKVKR